MAKFNMKDYEDFMEDEARQDRLQEEERLREYYEYFDEGDFDDDDDWDDDNWDDDDCDDDLYNCSSEFGTEDIVLECHIVKKSDERNQQEDRICRKAVARNRHHAAEKAKKKAEKSAKILEAKFWKLCSDVTSYKEANSWRSSPEVTERDAFLEDEYLCPNKMRQLYYSEKAAFKKANRVKVQTA